VRFLTNLTLGKKITLLTAIYLLPVIRRQSPVNHIVLALHEWVAYLSDGICLIAPKNETEVEIGTR